MALSSIKAKAQKQQIFNNKESEIWRNLRQLILSYVLSLITDSEKCKQFAVLKGLKNKEKIEIQKICFVEQQIKTVIDFLVLQTNQGFIKFESRNLNSKAKQTDTTD